MIDVQETVKRFGYDPDQIPKRQQTGVVISCDRCGTLYEMSRRGFDNQQRGTDRPCRACPEYRQRRSEIAKTSNKKRSKESGKYKKYLPFLDDLKTGKLNFLEVSKRLGLDDSTVCKFYSKHFGIKSRTGNKSNQEDVVADHLKQMFPQTERSVRYSSKTRHVADFFIPEINQFIEYDGSGFYHQMKKSDEYLDTEYKPIRLNCQAFFGGIDYLNFNLLGVKTGYCAVDGPSDYQVRPVKANRANDLLTCHSLGVCAGRITYGLFHQNKLIGVAKFGQTTNPHDQGTELRRFFVLDGTPRNTESWFLRQCEKMLPVGTHLTTYIHSHEKGSYLKALGWLKAPTKIKDYDFYKINGKLYNKRTVWGWAKKIGLVDKFGTTDAKEVLVSFFDGEKVMIPSKIKFTKDLI